MKAYSKEIFKPRKQYHFKDFQGNDEQVTRLRMLLTNPYQPLIVVSGPAGSGVTHLLNSAGNYFLEKEKKAGFITAQWLVEIYKVKRTKNEKIELISQLTEFDLLCIDNLQYLFRRSKQYSLFLQDLISEIKKKGKKLILGCSQDGKDISRSKKSKWTNDFIRIELQPLAGFTVFKILKRLCTPEDRIPDSLLFLISGYNGSIEQYINCLVSIRFRSKMLELELMDKSTADLESLFKIKSYFPEQQLRRSFIQGSLSFIESYRRLLKVKKQ